MLRRGTSRQPTHYEFLSSSPPMTTASPSADTPSSLFQNNQYAPDVKHLANEIGESLLDFSAETPLFDVVLQTSDNVNLPANKTLLAIRSSYFKKMFFSSFSETDASHISIPIRAEVLRNVLQFVYTADCTLIHDALSASPPLVDQQPRTASISEISVIRTLLTDLVDLAVAADYSNISQLQQLANDAISAMINVHPALACTALEAIRRNPMALQFCDTLQLWTTILSNPRIYFLVPDCGANAAVCDTSFLPRSDFGVLELSADTLDYLLQLVTAKSNHEYLFQVIYWWVNNSRGLEDQSTESEFAQHDDLHKKFEMLEGEAKERWCKGKKLTNYIDWTLVKPKFIRDVVENTGLVSIQVLFDAYKSHSLKNVNNVYDEDERFNE